MSYSGIRIKLFSAMPINLSESRIRIAVTMPKSGVSVIIKGSIRHFNEQAEYGVHYSEDNNKQVDDFMFECIKTAEPHHLLLQ